MENDQNICSFQKKAVTLHPQFDFACQMFSQVCVERV